MKLFIVQYLGSYAMEVQVHRAESEEALLPTLDEVSDDHCIWNRRTITEVSSEGAPSRIFAASYIE